MGFYKVHSATILGLKVEFVQVEADAGNGLPMFHMVGYLSSEVKEAAERVRTAMRNAGYTMPAKKIVINLSPACVRKKGSVFDLPIAVAVLGAMGIFPEKAVEDILLAGELGLDGKLQPVEGILPIVLEAKKAGFRCCVIPKSNEDEGRLAQGIQIFGAETLEEVCRWLKGEYMPQMEKPDREEAHGTEEWDIDYSDIQGQEAVKRATMVAVAGGHNLLYVGPPGSGKTMLARAMAGESDVAFLETSATQFMNSYVGKSEENIRRLFRTARKYAPAIIFIDEIDAIAKERTGDTTSQHTESMLNTLLTEMDGFRENVKEPVFVLAATNYDLDGSVSGKKRRIDPALLRRFDNRIYVDLPNEEERKQYLELKLNQKGKNKISEDIISNLAARTTGQSIAILQNVIELAMRNAAKAGTELSGERLLDALEEYNYGEKKTWEQGYYESVAIHESGHAYAAWCAGEKPSYVTIVSRGNFGGYMQHENSENKPNYSREDLLGKIRTSLAGRAAEKVFFGREASLNTGASSDLRSATDMAMRVIATYGMDEENLVCLSPEQILNTTLAKEFIERTNRLLKEQMKETENLICSGREKVEALAKKLLEQNHLTQNEIQDIFDET